MHSSDIQGLVDEIAAALGKGVSVDDLSGRLVTYSVQQGRADDARIRSLLTAPSPTTSAPGRTGTASPPPPGPWKCRPTRTWACARVSASPSSTTE